MKVMQETNSCFAYPIMFAHLIMAKIRSKSIHITLRSVQESKMIKSCPGGETKPKQLKQDRARTKRKEKDEAFDGPPLTNKINGTEM